MIFDLRSSIFDLVSFVFNLNLPIIINSVSNKSIYKHHSAFTLLEVLIAMGIFSLLVLAVSSILITSLRSNDIIWEQLETQSDGRRVLQQVVDLARKADQSSAGAYSIATADANEFIFYANVDNDSLRERVRFWLTDTTLKKGIIKPTGNPLQYVSGNEQVTELAHNVVNIAQNVPLFLYYDANYTGSGSALTQPVDEIAVRVIKVQFELEEAPTQSPVPLHLESTVSVRNLKSE